MKKLILLIVFLCFAGSAQASKVIAPAPPGSGTFAELDGDNEFTEGQSAIYWTTPLPSEKDAPDTQALRNSTDVPIVSYTPEGLTCGAYTEVISVPIPKTADFIIPADLAWSHVFTNADAGAAITGTLPAAKIGMEITVIDVNATHRISLDPGTELINGATTDQATSAQWDIITIKCYVDGSWIVTN
jgi:hypothetical protein